MVTCTTDASNKHSIVAMSGAISVSRPVRGVLAERQVRSKQTLDQ